MNGSGTLRFVEQVSDKPEQCTRCMMLHRDLVINVGETHWACIEDTAEMDSRPRVVLCQVCREFVRQQ